jgi:hypothetical protein
MFYWPALGLAAAMLVCAGPALFVNRESLKRWRAWDALFADVCEC